jgi:hypothetical protein
VLESLLLGPCPGRRTEYGPAVAGRAVSSGRGAERNFVGRIGATERPPCATVVDSDRLALTGTPSDGCDPLDTFDELEAVLMGENDDIAEPGRAGRFLVATIAFFCANIASLNEGLGGPVVLFENPNPGRALASGFLGELGLSGAFSSNLCWVASRPAIILYIY